MPCTAKKFEAKRPEFAEDDVPEVDHVLTTQELARMIEEAGLRFNKLEPESFDMPMGFKTGAGVIFGNSGGVSEAVLRYAAEKVTGQGSWKARTSPPCAASNRLRMATVAVDGIQLKLAVVHGLKNARALAEKVRRGEMRTGPHRGDGLPRRLHRRRRAARDARTRPPAACAARGLYEADKHLDLHKSQENHHVTECTRSIWAKLAARKAHHLLHTHYQNRRRIADERMLLGDGPEGRKVKVNVCVGTNCFLKGSQEDYERPAANASKTASAGTRSRSAPRSASRNAPRARRSRWTASKSNIAPAKRPARRSEKKQAPND